MSDLQLRKTDIGSSVLPADLVEKLRTEIRGTVALPGEPTYEQSRIIWNAMIDRHPAIVVRPAGAADVIRAVNFARDRLLLLSIRGGGHNIAGSAVCDGGLMIDLSAMKSVRIDPVSRMARVEPGVTLGEFDREAQSFGLATPTGINSTTGVSGLTLGGGFGWISRKFGLTVDNLLSVDIVTADGQLLRASDRENPDLFWAIRGGGGNFGVVTSFEFRLHPVGPQVLSGLLVHPLARAKEVLTQYRDVMAKASDDLSCWFILRKAPPLPFVPTEYHGAEVLVLAICYAGKVEDGRAAIAPLRAIGKPVAEMIDSHPYAGWQSMFDPLLTPGMRNYWKSHSFATLSDGAIDAFVRAAGQLPSPHCELAVAGIGGAINRVSKQATAYPHRDVNYVLNIHTRWSEPAEDAKCIKWARDLFDSATPFATGGVYVNFMPEDEASRVQSGAYGPNYERLMALKQKFDPGNLFRANQNIRPNAGKAS